VGVFVIIKLVDNANNYVAVALFAEDEVPMLEAATQADMKVLVSPEVLVHAIYATAEGSSVLVLYALALLTGDGDDLLNSTRTQGLRDTDVHIATNPVVINDVGTNKVVLTDVANDNILLLNTCGDGVRLEAIVMIEVVDDINNSVITVLVTEDDAPLFETTTDADVELIAPPAVMVDAVATTVQDPNVLVLTMSEVPGVDEDDLTDSARTEVLINTDIDNAMHPVMSDDVDAIMNTRTAVINKEVLLLNTCVGGGRVAATVILEVVDNVNICVLTMIVVENDVLLLETAADADVEVLVSPAVLAGTVTGTVEASGMLVMTAFAVIDGDRDDLFDSARKQVMVGKGVQITTNPLVLEHIDAGKMIALHATELAKSPVSHPPLTTWSRCTWPLSRNPVRMTEVDCVDLETAAADRLVLITHLCYTFRTGCTGLACFGGPAWVGTDMLAQYSVILITDQYPDWSTYSDRIIVQGPDFANLLTFTIDRLISMAHPYYTSTLARGDGITMLAVENPISWTGPGSTLPSLIFNMLISLVDQYTALPFPRIRASVTSVDHVAMGTLVKMSLVAHITMRVSDLLTHLSSLKTPPCKNTLETHISISQAGSTNVRQSYTIDIQDMAQTKFFQRYSNIEKGKSVSIVWQCRQKTDSIQQQCERLSVMNTRRC